MYSRLVLSRSRHYPQSIFSCQHFFDIFFDIFHLYRKILLKTTKDNAFLFKCFLK